MRSSHRKLTWVGFETKTTELCSDALTERAIRQAVQLALRANSVQLIQFDLFVSCSRFISTIVFIRRHVCFKVKSRTWNHIRAAEWTDMYGIHHWMILRGRHKKCNWVGFKPTITEFRSDAQVDWAVKSWAQHALRANFVKLLRFYLFFQCSRSISVIAFVINYIRFNRNHAQVITGVQRNELINIVFTNKGFWEVAIESWPDWDLNPGPLNSIQTL